MMISGRKVILLSLLLILIFGSLIVPVIAQDGIITIRVWRHVDAGFNDGDDALAAVYLEVNPGVTISFASFDYPTDIQRLQTALPVGTEADVLNHFGAWGYGYTEGGLLAPAPEMAMLFIEIFP